MTITDDNTTPRFRRLIDGFATRMGLVLVGSPTDDRLTDAFAVCNYRELQDQMGEKAYWELAPQVVDQVRSVLRGHGPDHPSTGWISGLDN